jgi:hypothetical protein
MQKVRIILGTSKIFGVPSADKFREYINIRCKMQEGSKYIYMWGPFIIDLSCYLSPLRSSLPTTKRIMLDDTYLFF